MVESNVNMVMPYYLVETRATFPVVRFERKHCQDPFRILAVRALTTIALKPIASSIAFSP